MPRLKSSLAPKKSKKNLRNDDSASDGFMFPARNTRYGPVSLFCIAASNGLRLTRGSNCGQPRNGNDHQAGEQMVGRGLFGLV
jgi:hypothetical protein